MMIPQPVMQAISLLNDAGFSAYLVGGCVRDTVLHIPPHDYDLCTSATPGEMQQVFSTFRTIETGLKHGTLTVLMGEYPLEITTYRLDGEYLDNRHPKEVIFTRKLDNDLSRRDFTINAMAYHPNEGLVDLFGGQEDCKNKILRCVGRAATRFEEDALRILRALRFAAVYGFSIESETAKAAHELCHTLSHVAKERITVEFSKLVCGDAAQSILEAHASVLGAVLPCTLHTEGLHETSAQLPLRLAHVLQDAADLPNVLSFLRLDNATAQAATELIAHKNVEMPSTDAEWKLLLHKLGQERALQLSAWKSWDVTALQAILVRGDCWNLKTLAVTGKDLMEAGVPKGREVGRMLEMLLQAVIEEKVINEKAALLGYMKQQKIGG